MISTEHVIDFDNLVLTSKEVFDDYEYLIVEHDGYYSEEDQYLYFDFKGIEKATVKSHTCSTCKTINTKG